MTPQTDINAFIFCLMINAHNSKVNNFILVGVVSRIILPRVWKPLRIEELMSTLSTPVHRANYW